jgi:hypothetical protein
MISCRSISWLTACTKVVAIYSHTYIHTHIHTHTRASKTYIHIYRWQNDSTSWLAAGTKEGVIILFSADVANGVYTKVGLLKGHTADVTSIDFVSVSADSKPVTMRVSHFSSLSLSLSPLPLSFSLCVYMYAYICIYIYMYIYTHTHILTRMCVACGQ